MDTSVTVRSATGAIIQAVLLLSLGSFAVADTWDSIDDIDFVGNLSTGAQLAVAEVMFLPRVGQEALTLLIAITVGDDMVKLYSFNTGTGYLYHEDDITVSVTDIVDPIAWTPTFMDLDIEGTGEESCLVIPTLCDPVGEDAGSISIVRLTERVAGSLVVMDDCFNCDQGNHWSIWHVAELPVSGYAISTEIGTHSPPNIDDNVIMLATYDSDNSAFEDDNILVLPNIYFGASHTGAWARPWVTAFQDFRYGEFNATLCYTTTHNGGVVIWEPEVLVFPIPIVSRIAASQHGGWDYEEEVGGELGDVHRAVILEGGSGTFSDLDDIQIDSRLLFFSNNVTGFIVCDVSKPDAPQFVWQWDCDTRPREDDGNDADWNWHGAGNMDDDVIDNQADPGLFPGQTFGIGVASKSDFPPIIHVYLAGGVDGLRLFDLSEFLDPFGLATATNESSFDDFSIDIYDSYEVGVIPMQAYDLQTFSEGGDTYVFTSWREAQEGEDLQIGLTVHFDEGVD